MRKFQFRLQKVLELRNSQHEAIRSRLMALTEESVQVKTRIMTLQMELRSALSDIASLPPEIRFIQQPLLLRAAGITEEDINRLQNKLQEIESKRQQTLDELMEVRKAQKALENLREKKYAEFVAEQEKNEQNYLDDITSTKFAYNIINDSLSSTMQ